MGQRYQSMINKARLLFKENASKQLIYCDEQFLKELGAIMSREEGLDITPSQVEENRVAN